MRTESFITSYFGIGMISLYHIIVYNNRKSTSHYLIVYHRYYLPFRKNPDKRFYFPATEPLCADMKTITLEKIAEVLGTGANAVTVPAEVADKAKLPLERMLELGR